MNLAENPCRSSFVVGTAGPSRPSGNRTSAGRLARLHSISVRQGNATLPVQQFFKPGDHVRIFVRDILRFDEVCFKIVKFPGFVVLDACDFPIVHARRLGDAIPIFHFPTEKVMPVGLRLAEQRR